MLKSIDSGVTRGINNGDSYFHSVVCVNTTSTVAPVVLKTYTGAIEFDKSFINYANVNTSSLLIPTQLVSTGATKVDMIDSNKSLTATNSFLQQSKAGMVRMGKFFFKASH